MRLRFSPEVTIAIGLTFMTPGERMQGTSAELVGSRQPCPDDVSPYERLLGDALSGDSTLFARQDFIEEAWRIVDPVLKAGTPIHEYEPNTWGPTAVTETLSPDGGWHNPNASG